MATYTNQLLVLVGGTIQKISSTDNLAIGGSLSIGGNLDVTGDIISHGTVNVVTADSFIDLNSGNTGTTEKAGGFTVQIRKGTAFGAPKTITSFNSTGATTGGGPYIGVANGDEAAFTAGDVIAVSGVTGDGVGNNGLFVVLNVTTAGQIAIESSAVSQLPFAQTALTTVASPTGTPVVYGVDLAGFAFSDGVISKSGPTAIAVGTPCYFYEINATKSNIQNNWLEFGGGGGGVTNLQQAYEGGNTISMTAADGAFDVSPNGAEVVGFSIDGAAASNVSVTGNNLTLSTITSGTLAVSSAGLLDIDANSDLSLNSAGLINIGNDADSQNINIGTGAAPRLITVGNQNTTTEVQIDTGTAGFDVNALGAASISSVGNSEFAVTSGNLALSAATTGSVLVDGVDGVELNSTSGGIAIGNDANTGAIDIGTGASARTITIGNGTSSTAVDINTGSGGLAVSAAGASSVNVTSGTLDVDAAGNLSINSSGGVINVGDDAVAQAINIGTGAAARTITIGNSTGATEVQIDAGSGSVDINSADGVTIDGTGISIDGTAASNFTVTNNNLTLSTTGSGAIDVTSAGILDVDAASNIQINSSGGTIQIGNDNVSQNIDLGTGGSRKVTIGATGGSTEVEINAGSGTVDINSGAAVTIDAAANSNFTVAGANLSLKTTTSGTIDVTSAGAMDIDAATTLQINSSGGAISIGNDAVAQNINVGTGAAARVITIGNATGATEVQIDAGTAGVDINAASGGAITIDTTAAGITLTTTTSGDVSLVAAGNVVLNAGSSGHISADDKVIFAAAGGIDQDIATGIAVGKVLYFDSSGVGQLADANGAAAAQEVNGIALQENISGGNASRQVSSVFGTKVYVDFVSAPAAGDIAYLSETAGEATVTAPSAAGSVIFRIGKVLSATPDGSGNYPVLFNPQYIATN
jgi:hypothetical protein